MWWTNETCGSHTPLSTQHPRDLGGGITYGHPPPNCSFLKPKQSMKLNKLFVWNRLPKYINDLIIYPTIGKSDNLLLNQLSQVIAMNFNMLHLTVCNRIINDLNCTLIIIMNNSWGLNRKPDLSQELSDPKILSTSINDTMILSFISE